jgi:hypothetical protein
MYRLSSVLPGKKRIKISMFARVTFSRTCEVYHRTVVGYERQTVLIIILQFFFFINDSRCAHSFSVPQLLHDFSFPPTYVSNIKIALYIF